MAVFRARAVAVAAGVPVAAVGLGRAALLAVDTDDENGLVKLVECLSLELRLLISALGKYHVAGSHDHEVRRTFVQSL